MNEWKVRIEFTTELLGTAPLDKEIYTKYIEAKAIKAGIATDTSDEVETIKEMEEKGITGFRRVGDAPMLPDYMIKGFFKAACAAMREEPKTHSSYLKAYKSKIDKLVFIEPRFIVIQNPGEITLFQRPLRGQTAQGERIALACSEMIQPGAFIEFTVKTFGTAIDEETLREWLDYGQYSGIGQFRNGAYGRFVFSISSIR